MNTMTRTFTKEEIFDIRQLYWGAKNQKAQIDVMAQLYACKKKDILRLLEPEDTSNPPVKNTTARCRFSDEIVQQAVRDVLDNGEKQADIAIRLGVTASTISLWVSKERKRRQAEGTEPTQEAPKPKPKQKFKTIRFVMKSGAVFEVCCKNFDIRRDSNGKSVGYWFDEPSGIAPYYICGNEVAAVLGV